MGVYGLAALLAVCKRVWEMLSESKKILCFSKGLKWLICKEN